MKHFYLIANPLKQGTKEMAKKIADYLGRAGASCTGSMQTAKKNQAGGGYTDIQSIPPKTECVITLGGDGTLIQAARDLVSLQLPLIGINMGTLGYLTQISRGEELEPMLNALLQDKYRLEKRMMLEGMVLGQGMSETGIALNEIVLTRQDVMQPLRFQVSVNGQFLNEYAADGIIVATPTGSTAYNLSAGGPIVTPGAELLVLTPICSHALNSSSIVLSPYDTITIQVHNHTGQKQMAVFDGDQAMNLDGMQTLRIRRSKSYTTLIQLKNESFLNSLREKMNRV